MTTSTVTLVTPYGGKLIDLVVPHGVQDELREYAHSLPSVRLPERSVCDLELLATGAFSPLDRFMGQEDFLRVVDEMRLASGYLFPIPVSLPVEPSAAIWSHEEIALRNAKNELLAIMEVEDIYQWNHYEVAQKVFGTQDLRHPLVSEMYRWGKLNISGRLRVLQLPRNYDFQDIRLTPAQARSRLEDLGYENVVAFQTRNPLHRVHEEFVKRAVQEVDGALLLHPAVGMARPGDVDHYTRVRTYKALAQNYYDPNRILLSLLPLAMRLAGPREALWHALIRRNYGVNYLIVGRDHASPGVDSTGKPFYSPYDAQKLVEQYSEEIGSSVIPFMEVVYPPEEGRYAEAHARPTSISGTQVREEYGNNGKQLQERFTRREVDKILTEAYPLRHREGVCIWFTGLSGAGKSTTAEILTVLLSEHGRQVTLLDGDVMRTHLSKGLGFSKEDRDTNIRSIGFVASEIVQHGGVVIAAAVSPYRATRDDIRNKMRRGHFVEVYVDTPLEVCEQRDVKGMYAKARMGEIKGFTGVDDPYEPPLHPEVTLNTVTHMPEANARLILNHLIDMGLVKVKEQHQKAAAASRWG